MSTDHQNLWQSSRLVFVMVCVTYARMTFRDWRRVLVNYEVQCIAIEFAESAMCDRDALQERGQPAQRQCGSGDYG